MVVMLSGSWSSSVAVPFGTLWSWLGGWEGLYLLRNIGCVFNFQKPLLIFVLIFFVVSVSFYYLYTVYILNVDLWFCWICFYFFSSASFLLLLSVSVTFCRSFQWCFYFLLVNHTCQILGNGLSWPHWEQICFDKHEFIKAQLVLLSGDDRGRVFDVQLLLSCPQFHHARMHAPNRFHPKDEDWRNRGDSCHSILHHVTFQSCPFFLYSNHGEFLRWACNFYWILCWLLKQLIANHISQWKKRPHLNLNCCDSHTYEWTMLWSARRITNESPCCFCLPCGKVCNMRWSTKLRLLYLLMAH